MTKSEIQSEALAFLQEHLAKTSEGTCWVTKNKAINMRYVWDVVRENYYGIFKKPKDRFNQDKIFYPLTETITWENVKNIDLDTKDINARATAPEAIDEATLVRHLVKDWMRKTFFGEVNNRWMMYYTLDGHLIVETDYNADKKELKVTHVDNRNAFYDLHCDDIQKVPFMVRIVTDLDEIRNMKGWINIDKIEGRFDVPKIFEEQKEYISSVPEVEVFKTYSKIPKRWITGRRADKEYVDGVIWASNITGNGLIHRIEINDKGYTPFEDVAFEDAPNRHPGRGVGEKLLFLQIYLNTIYNIRRNNNLVMMNQLFKFRDGTGVTPEKIANLVAGGAIGLQDIKDFERIDTRNINFTESINEEQNLVQVANRVTSSQEAATGEQLPSSTPATNAILQSQAVKTSHQLRQERYGLFLTRLFSRQLLPYFGKLYKKGDKFALDPADKNYASTKKTIAENLALSEYQEGADYNALVQEKLDGLDKRDQIFIELDKDINTKDIEIEFFVTDESFDKNTILQNLQQVLFNYSKFAQDPAALKVLREIYDVLGLDTTNLMPEQTQNQSMIQPLPGQPQEGQMTQNDLVTQQSNRVNNQVTNI